MKGTITLLLISLVYTSALAQYSLSGKITHLDNQDAVIGATLFIPDLRIGATTDVNGDYKLVKLPKGTFTVQISYVSHRTIIEKITIDGDVVKNYVMENAVTSLEEVIVSGAATKTVIKESPIPIAARSQIQLLQTSSTNLVDAVSRMPGMSQVSTGAGLSKPIIRGLGFNRVITMHDGVRQEDNQWGEEHSIQVDEYSIDRYEIIRGAGSLMYGSDGLGGVMAILSPRPVEDGKIVGRVLTNYQTNHNLIGLSAQIAGNKNGFTWLFQSSTKNSKNYRNANDGRVFGSNFYEPINFNGFLGINRKWGYTRVYFLRSEQRFNIITGTRDARGRFTNNFVNRQGEEEFGAVTDKELESRDMIPWNSQHLVNSKITSQTLLQFKNESALSINLSYARNQRNEFGTVFNPFRTDLGLGLQTYYYDVRYALAPRNGWETTIGSNGMTQSLTNSGAQTLYPNYTLLDNGVFLFTKKSYDRLKLSGGIRYDVRALDIAKLYVAPDGTFQSTEKPGYETRFTGFERTYQNVSASAGGVYNLTDKLAVRLNGSRGFRAPTVPELSSNGEHVGTFRYEIGNLKAVPEVAYQGDLGLTYEGKNVYFEISVFQNSIQNYTYSERVQGPTGRDSVINGAPVFRYTQGNARLRGMEGTITLNPAQARWFSFTQSYSAVFGSNISAKDPDAKYLPFMPPPRWISQVKFTKDRWKNRFRNLYVNLDVEVNQRQDRFLAAYDTETATAAYTLVNMGLGGDVTGNSRKTLFSVYLAATNLLDIAYQAHQSRLKYLDANQATGRIGVFNMGRNVSFKVVIPFETGN